LIKRLPKLADVPFEEAWAGMIDVMPDVVPVIDHVMRVPRLVSRDGFQRSRFRIGPGAGRVVAEWCSAARATTSRFRLSRFADGSKAEVGPGL
jgi:glycine/D-amino acid oxidase-like deaminating enzyme